MRYVPQQLTRPVGVAVSLGVSLTLICPGSITRAQLPTFEALQPQPPPASLAQSQAEYTLGGGDHIRLDILEVPQYSGEYQILPGGSLSLPLIGSVRLEGLTDSTSNHQGSHFTHSTDLNPYGIPIQMLNSLLGSRSEWSMLYYISRQLDLQMWNIYIILCDGMNLKKILY